MNNTNRQRLSTLGLSCAADNVSILLIQANAVKLRSMKKFLIFYLVIATWLLSACATSLKSNHPQLQKDAQQAHATVYFIRPFTERTMAMADNAIAVEIDSRPLLNLAKGEYIRTLLMPGQVWLTVNSRTTWGPSHKIKSKSKTRSFTFESGETYFISITPVNGEFRGVHFIAETVSQNTAKKLSKNLRLVDG